MINRIKFRNFILIKELELDFFSGMNVITGETGAGKSVLVGGLNLVLGGMVRGNYFYEQDKSIYLEVDFQVDKSNLLLLDLINKYSIETEDDELFITKEITKNGKSTSFINGRRVTNTIVKEFREVLLDFHSQNEQLNLNNPEYQLHILDAYGGLEALKQEVADSFQLWTKEKAKLRDLIKRDKELAEKAQLYKYQVEELEGLNLRSGESEELDKEYNILINADEIVTISRKIVQEFYEEENSFIDKYNKALSQIEPYRSDLPQIASAAEYLHDAKSLIEDGISSLREVDHVVSVDQERLQLVEDRIKLIEDMKSKYRLNSVELLLAYFEEINKFLFNRSAMTTSIEEQQKLISKLEQKLLSLADKLSQQRVKYAKKLKQEIEENVEHLSLPKAKVEFQFSQIDENKLAILTEKGYDQVELFFSANLGVAMQPLKDSASGGELSRMLLALKKILADKLDARSMIFDEIDVGIGGNTAIYIADYIAQIGDKHQVICISHLPQVAAKGSSHFKILKSVDKGKTEIRIKLLTQAEREVEISRMLAGTVSETSLKHAKEILKQNLNPKQSGDF